MINFSCDEIISANYPFDKKPLRRKGRGGGFKKMGIELKILKNVVIKLVGIDHKFGHFELIFFEL